MVNKKTKKERELFWKVWEIIFVGISKTFITLLIVTFLIICLVSGILNMHNYLSEDTKEPLFKVKGIFSDVYTLKGVQFDDVSNIKFNMDTLERVCFENIPKNGAFSFDKVFTDNDLKFQGVKDLRLVDSIWCNFYNEKTKRTRTYNMDFNGFEKLYLKSLKIKNWD